MNRRLASAGAGLILLGLTAACDRSEPGDAPPPLAPAEDTGEPTASIIRPSVRAEMETRIPAAPDPVHARVLFDYGSADLSDAARAELDRVGATDGLVAEGWSIILTGRTDRRGSAAANLRMARERAAAVQTYLTEAGVPATRLSVVAAGETGPAEDQDSDDDGASARRVDVLASPPTAD